MFFTGSGVFRIVKKGVTFLTVAALVGGCLLYVFTPLPVEQVTEWPVSPALRDREGRFFHLRLSGDSEWSIPVPLSEMGKWLPLAATGVEDRRFRSHPGVDAPALARALWTNLTAGRIVSGASTITSQLIRLSISERALTPEGIIKPAPRSLSTKAREFIQALRLERVMTKDKILELYLNRAPFGGNIRGVQAASLIYFGKPASRVSPGEACLLIGMLRGPSLYRPDRHPEAARRRRDAIIGILEERGVFTKDEARLARLEDLPSRWIQPPMRAFHFAEMVLKDRSLSGQTDTTLDLEIQTKLEAVLSGAVSVLPPSITMAAGVLDNETGGLLAWVGNARFGKGGKNAWVDCGQALRSPGSALKPFAYLAAFDQGLLTPSSLLADSPLAFSGRAPRNFDLTYRGAVSARVALSDSLNAPAVRVLRMAGPAAVLELMRSCGLRSLNRNAAFYGDSLILGGCDVSVLQMLEACAVIANEGVHRPLTLLKRREGLAVRLSSRAAAWMVTDILDNFGQVSALTREALGGTWHVALKTGTSYGLRDAWTAAWTPRVTVVVWVGDPAGTPWGGLVGVQMAAPAALSILRIVSPEPQWYAPPPGLVLREVCSLSGRPPTAACLSTRLDWSIEGTTRTVPCDIHVIRAGKSALVWPVDLTGPDPARIEIRKTPSVVITSPLAEATYYLAPLAKEQKIPLRTEGARGQVWWYLDGKYIGTSAPLETFFHDFPDGRHRLAVSDAEGRTAATRFTVVSPGAGKSRGADGEIPLLD
jgi:penicillin-binding protein 1C